eukprot:473814-Pelagomonas_calceolata.AAC.4
MSHAKEDTGHGQYGIADVPVSVSVSGEATDFAYLYQRASYTAGKPLVPVSFIVMHHELRSHASKWATRSIFEEEVEPVQAMTFLNMLVSHFDMLVDVHGVHKVGTHALNWTAWTLQGRQGMDTGHALNSFSIPFLLPWPCSLPKCIWTVHKDHDNVSLFGNICNQG